MIHDFALHHHVDTLPQISRFSPVTAFLMRGWRWTLLATILGSLTVTAGVILMDGPLWVLILDWAVTVAYAGLVAISPKRD